MKTEKHLKQRKYHDIKLKKIFKTYAVQILTATFKRLSRLRGQGQDYQTSEVIVETYFKKSKYRKSHFF